MFRRLDHRAGHYLLLFAVWAVLCLPNLGGPSLWDIDEGNNVRCSWEMLQSGNYIVPTFNGCLREDKPVLIYWLQIACAGLFGPNEWAGRFPSAAAALLTVLAVYELGRQTFGVRAALLAGVILATSLGPIGAAHFANPDALLLAFTTWSLALFWSDYRTGGRGWLVGVGVASGLAVLAKGPVGLVMPAGVALLFLAWQRQLSRLWDSRLPGMVLAFVLTAAPWYIWVAVETHGAWVVGFWNKHHVNRMTTALENHSGPPWYYVVVLLTGLAPWSIFIGPTLWHAWRLIKDEEVKSLKRLFALLWHAWRLIKDEKVKSLKRLFAASTFGSVWRWLWTADGSGEAEPAAARFLLVWFGVYFVFFSAVRTKLPNYILPAYPAAALLTAHLLERWRRGETALPVWLVRTSMVCLALIGVGAAAALVLAARFCFCDS